MLPLCYEHLAQPCRYCNLERLLVREKIHAARKGVELGILLFSERPNGFGPAVRSKCWRRACFTK
jgi:hypothetical protein